MTTAYPLAWPPGFPRTKNPEKSRFNTTLKTALANVQTSLRLFAKDSGKNVSDVVMSSNVTLGSEMPSDAGVAVYFTWDQIAVVIPVDRYQTVAENLQAIHHIIEARRTELRHGTLNLVRASFQGFLALPPSSSEKWWDVLGVSPDASEKEIESAYLRKARSAHPDAGGSNESMAALNRAREEALKSRGSYQ